jgi:hypothetical protein
VMMPHRPQEKRPVVGLFSWGLWVGSQDSDKTIRTTRMVVMMWTMMLLVRPTFDSGNVYCRHHQAIGHITVILI